VFGYTEQQGWFHPGISDVSNAGRAVVPLQRTNNVPSRRLPSSCLAAHRWRNAMPFEYLMKFVAAYGCRDRCGRSPASWSGLRLTRPSQHRSQVTLHIRPHRPSHHLRLNKSITRPETTSPRRSRYTEITNPAWLGAHDEFAIEHVGCNRQVVLVGGDNAESRLRELNAVLLHQAVHRCLPRECLEHAVAARCAAIHRSAILRIDGAM